MKLYLILGQGYDERIFKNPDISDYLNWIESNPNKTLEDFYLPHKRFFI